jgi:release factor glutamine methyltransferase
MHTKALDSLMTIGEAQQHGETVLAQAGIDSGRIDTALLLKTVLKQSRAWLLAHDDETLTLHQKEAFLKLLKRRAERNPLVHLTNTREFYGLDLYINPDVLTPRIETETMVDYAIKHAPKNSRLIDIGTGSGAIAIAIKQHRPDLTIIGTDVTDESLAVAKRNITHHKVGVELIKSDLFEHVNGLFETVVTNLPYLKNDADLMPEVQKEPAVALFGGSDGLELYRKFLSQLPTHLSPGGFLFTECDPWQHEDLIIEAGKAGLHPIEEQDYFILGFQKQ